MGSPHPTHPIRGIFHYLSDTNILASTGLRVTIQLAFLCYREWRGREGKGKGGGRGEERRGEGEKKGKGEGNRKEDGKKPRRGRERDEGEGKGKAERRGRERELVENKFQTLLLKITGSPS